MVVKEDFIDLRKEFEKIKKMGFIASLRNGFTGVGNTFETLLGKNEDRDVKPDYKSIEIKTKFAYSTSPMVLFRYTPMKNKEYALNYILEKYSYQKRGYSNLRIFSREIYAKQFIEKNKYSFKLKVDYPGKEIMLQAFYNGNFIENVCAWDFKTLQYKLITKLSNLAIIYAYPYKISGKTYYKYVKMKCYKLKGLFEFLQLVENDKIHVSLYMNEIVDADGEIKLDYHGAGFRIANDSIEQLFTKLNY